MQNNKSGLVWSIIFLAIYLCAIGILYNIIFGGLILIPIISLSKLLIIMLKILSVIFSLCGLVIWLLYLMSRRIERDAKRSLQSIKQRVKNRIKS